MVSPIRMGGLVSGLDTDKIVKDLMKAERMPLDKLKRKKQTEEWKRDAYREMNTLLLDFRNNTVSNLKLQGTFLKKTITSSDDSAVTVKSSGIPNLSSYSIVVNKLAEPSTPSTVSYKNSLADANTQIGSAFSFDIVGNGGMSKTISVLATDTINDVIGKINKVSADTKVVASYNTGDKSITFTSTTNGAASSVQVTAAGANPLGITSTYSLTGSAVDLATPINTTNANKIQFTVNGGTLTKEIQLPPGFVFDGTGPGRNVSDLAIAIQDQINLDNDLVKAGLKVTVDSGNKLVFSAKEAVTLGAGSSNDLLGKIGFSNGVLAAGAFKSGTDGVAGEVIINGQVHSISSNTFTYDQMEFTVKKATPVNVTVTVKPDEDAVFNAIKGFVDKYNETIDKLNKKISEPVYRDYQPLLDEEKESLSEDQIKKWEEKAKSGVLRRDSILSSVLVDMRRALSDPVQGVSDLKYDTLKEIGISTMDANKDKYAYMDNGKLYIDEAKLRTEIRENGTKVMDLFTRISSATDADTKYNESGIAQRMYDKLKGAIDKIIDLAGSTGSPDESEYYLMGKEMRKINKDISDWETRLKGIEDRYWKQFDAMERALQQLNSQSTWFMQQFGGGK